MLGYIETLRGHAKNDPTAREMFLGIMQEQAERMQRLIVDILSLRKIEQIEHIIPTERADLGLAAKAALEAVHPIAKRRNVNVSLNGKKKNALVMGSQDELVQLSLNLIDNAVRMSPPKSKVTIKVDRLNNWMPGDQFSHKPIIEDMPRRRIVIPPKTAQDYWRLSVRDAGPGFKPEHLPRLGERFYRIAGDRSSKEKGTGLGLAIVKHIVRWHRGGFYIESAEGHGTEFIIILPLAPDISDDNSAESAPMQRGFVPP
jgi:two-component system phosphate regulon sensor histidine kinase PhoR